MTQMQIKRAGFHAGPLACLRNNLDRRNPRHRLRGSEQRGVENLRVVDVAGDLLGLVDDAVDGRAGHALRIVAVHAEHLLDQLDLLRLSTGIEDVEDLYRDLDEALRG